MSSCKDSLLLIKSIGLPGLFKGEVPTFNEAYRLLQVAELNKIPLLFLESLRELGEYKPLEDKLLYYKERCVKTMDLIATISSLLGNSGVHYTIFKTLKSFPYTPADIDVLLWSKKDLAKVFQVLETKGLKPLEKSPYGLTMFSISHDIYVDLTTEVSTSGLIYLDKDILFKHVTQVKIEGFKVQTLQPYADLVAVATHSIFKEWMYTLSDYYTIALWLNHLREARRLAEILHVSRSLDIVLSLTYAITLSAFGANFMATKTLKNAVPKGIAYIPSGDIKLPLKYSPYILLKCFVEKMRNSKTRNSVFTLVSSMLQPKFINKLLNHITRETY